MGKETCMCGISVTATTKCLGWIFLILNMISFVSTFFLMFETIGKRETDLDSGHLLANLCGSTIAITCTCLMLIGAYKHLSGFFIPFLIYSFVVIVSALIATVYYFVEWFLVWINYEGHGEASYRGLIRPGIIGVCGIIHFYFFYVIPNRARQVLAVRRYPMFLQYY